MWCHRVGAVCTVLYEITIRLRRFVCNSVLIKTPRGAEGEGGEGWGCVWGGVASLGLPCDGCVLEVNRAQLQLTRPLMTAKPRNG